MIRLVAIDLDNTLLRSDLSISSTNRNALKRAREAGVVIAIATGRMFQTASLILSDLGPDMPVAAYNGALIRMRDSGETLCSMPIQPDDGERVVRFLWDFDVAFQAYFDDQLYVPRLTSASAYYSSRYGAAVHVLSDIDEFARRPSLKYLIIEDPGRIDSVRQALEGVIGPNLRTMRSQPGMLEIVDSRVSKGRALRHLASHFSIDIAHTMAIGDSENDIDMLREAAIGVAVSGADHDVKAVADYVVASNDNDGVAEALDMFVSC
ncbi:MAG TPA: HAD family hydrolase [Bacillota bacterium]|nr:HAD family hydrolase [Bacillota bacterium]